MTLGHSDRNRGVVGAGDGAGALVCARSVTATTSRRAKLASASEAIGRAQARRTLHSLVYGDAASVPATGVPGLLRAIAEERLARRAVKAAQGAFAAGHKFWGNQWSQHAQDPANDPPGHEPSGKIKHAVLVIGGKRYRGPSHFQAWKEHTDEADKTHTPVGEVIHEGFETESGHFLNRSQAAKYAEVHEGLSENILKTVDGQLYTQDRVMAASPKFGCLMAMLPSLDSILPNWASDNIPSGCLHEEGIETEPHVTVLYGFSLSFDASKIAEVLSESAGLKLGKVSRFKCPEYDVLKVDVDSGDLEKLNANLAKVFGNEITKSKHDYHPHLTIAYVKKGTCKELDGRDDFEGWQPHVGQLLYSLPDKQGRRVFNLGASAKAVQATAPTKPHDFTAHEQARAKAEAHYKRALAKIIAQAEASALAARLQDEDERKRRRAHDTEAALLLLLLAGFAAYKAAYKRLSSAPQGALSAPGVAFPAPATPIAPSGSGGTAISLPAVGPVGSPSLPAPIPTGPVGPLSLSPAELDTDIDEQAEVYAQGRAELLKDVPGKVRDTLDAELAKPEAEVESLRELSDRLGKVAQRIEDGYGKMVANTETHTAYGHAALRVLAWQGYATKIWQAVGDERTCPTCMSCEDRGPLPMGAEFIPGVVAPPAHNSCRCWLVGGSKVEPVKAIEPVMAVHIETYTRTDPRTGKQETVEEHDDKRQKFTGKEGGVPLKRIGEEENAKWVTHDDKDIPEHAKKLGIPPAWQNVRIAPTPEHDLQAVGHDAKGREQRIYSKAFVAKQAALKFSRNKELMEKRDKIFKQNDANLKSDDAKTRENAACMKLIQQTGIRPGSDADTGADKQAYGATTLLGKHVVVGKDLSVRLVFTGKKGVDLDIPVEDPDTAEMIRERKEKAGDDGRLFDTDDAALRDYSHTLDGGSFKPKDFRTLKGTMTALEAIKKEPKPALSMKEFKKRVMAIAEQVAEKLGNTPTIALQSYINPFVFEAIKPQEA